jgi:hypothetical protein
MPSQGWVSLANDPFAGGAPIAAVTSNTFTTGQDLSTGTTGTLGVPITVPANLFKAGQCWRFTAAGTYSVTATPTLLFGIQVGTASQVASPALTASSGVTTMNWRMTVDGTVRTIGGTTVGTMLLTGMLMYAVTSNTAAPSFLPIWAAPIAVGTGFDTTAANKLTPYATYSASSASNIVVLHEWLAEYLD